MNGFPPEIQAIIEEVLKDWKEKQSRIRLPLMLTIEESLEILKLLQTMRKK